MAKHFTTVPMPQVGHQMCGIRSIRMYGAIGCSLLACSLCSRTGYRLRRAHRAAPRMASADLLGIVDPAAGVRDPIAAARPAAQRSTSRTICPKLISGTTKALIFPASSRMRASGKGQHTTSRSVPDLRALLARHLDARRATREVMP